MTAEDDRIEELGITLGLLEAQLRYLDDSGRVDADLSTATDKAEAMAVLARHGFDEIASAHILMLPTQVRTGYGRAQIRADIEELRAKF